MNRLLTRFLQVFFHLLYGTFAWTYDFVAAVVSIGRWKYWIQTVLPYLTGDRILELGHGPGHLQRILHTRGLLPFGLDYSPQMGKQARENLRRNGYAQHRLTRGEAQNLPFPGQSFDCIVSTFPTEYFYHPNTLAEVRRTLKNGGRYVVLPVAWVTGKGAIDRAAAWLFKVTGQAPSDLSQKVTERLITPIKKAGFTVQTERVKVKFSQALIIIAFKE
ncbi:MAG: class I SAM-dependent methyltransferase [Anaerolineales bacterium]